MADRDWIFSLADIAKSLPDDSVPMRYTVALEHGTMELGLYAPRGPDVQKPHTRDELYVSPAARAFS